MSKKNSSNHLVEIILIIFIVGSVYYFFFGRKKQEPSKSEVFTSQFPQNRKNFKDQTDNNPTKPTYNESVPNNPLAVSEPIKLADKSFEDDTNVVTSEDRYGGRAQIVPRKKESVKELIERNKDFDPIEEFKSLTNIDFSNEESKMFSGAFVDSNSKIKIALYYDGNTQSLGDNSCIVLPNGEKISSAGGQFQVRDDKNGYALIMIKQNWFLRMGYSFPSTRVIIGMLYAKSGDSWNFVTDVNATEAIWPSETTLEDQLKTCKFP